MIGNILAKTVIIMVTISHLVENYVRKKPFLEDALSKGIINYAYLAASMKPDIEKELRKPVKTSAIMMALRRVSESLKKEHISPALVMFKETDLTLKSGLFEMTVIKSPRIIECLKKAYGLADFSKGDFLTITHGLYEMTIISSDKYKPEIQKIFENEKIVLTGDNLASLTVKLPVESIETMGLFYVVTKSLNWENINIVEIVSTLTEMTFILKEDDVARAFNTIKLLIKENEAAPSAPKKRGAPLNRF